jgi:large subunit ribosomal protein L20
MANAAVMKSLNYARIHRKEKKRDFRKLWIARINAAARMNGMTYSRFIDGLRKANVQINRKMLADLAVSQPEAFSELVALAKNQVGAVGQSQ